MKSSPGPQWNQALRNPNHGAFRFGGKFLLGFLPTHSLAIQGGVWGNFLEEATMVAGGPGITAFFGDTNISLTANLGVGTVFNLPKEGIENFRETILAGEVSLAKLWWVSPRTSLGLSASVGGYGFTLSQRTFSSIGWYGGLRMDYVFN